jgi:hypothetical protein
MRNDTRLSVSGQAGVGVGVGWGGGGAGGGTEFAERKRQK